MTPMPPQLTAQQIEALRKIDSATLCNAIETFDVRDATAGYASLELRCMFSELPPVTGYAVTCTVDSTTPRPGGPSGLDKLVRALAAAPKPAIVVMKAEGQEHLRNCNLGDVLCTIFSRMGTVAAVSDAGVRDLAGIAERAPGFQVFGAGCVASHGAYTIVDVGTTVAVCGLTVSPGDLLHGDANGLASIPHAIADRLPEAANEVLAAESRIVDYVKGPDFDPETLAERLAGRD